MKVFLSECIDSILNQRHDNLEIVLINDSTNDPAIEIMEDYLHRYPERIIIDIRDSDLLPGGARNRGLSLASGEFVTFVDGDDWLDASMYHTLMPYFENDEVDMVISDFNECVVENGMTISRPRSSLPEGIYTPINSGRLFNKASYAWNSIFRRSLFDSIAFRFPEGLLYEDLAVHLLFAKSRKIAYIPLALYQHRKHAKEITNIASSNQHCMIIEVVEWLTNEFSHKVDMTIWSNKFNELLIYFLFQHIHSLMLRGYVDMNEGILNSCAETFVNCGGVLHQDMPGYQRLSLQLESPIDVLMELKRLKKLGKEVVYVNDSEEL